MMTRRQIEAHCLTNCLIILAACCLVSSENQSGSFKTKSQLGLGYDLLINHATRPVFKLNKTCTNSSSSETINVQEDRRNSQFESKHFLIVESMHEYQLVTARSMSKIYPLAGVYSHEYKHKRDLLTFNDYVYLRIEMHRNGLGVRSKEFIYDCAFDHVFVNELAKIVSAVRESHDDKAAYLAQILVHEYGTHVLVNQALGGSALFMEVFVDTDYYQSIVKLENKDLELIIMAYFDSKYSLGLNLTNNKLSGGDLIKFAEHAHHSHLFSVGGGDGDELAVLDKVGIELSKLSELSPSRLAPQLIISEKELETVRSLIDKATELYMSQNTHRGCMKKTYRSFDKSANLHVQTMCTNESLFPGEYYYGGVILSESSSSSNSIRLENILTGTYHCDDGYKEVLVPFAWNQVLTFCLAERLQQKKQDQQQLQPRPTRQVYFGGGYSLTEDNWLTGKKKCPRYFYSRRLGLSEKFICESFEDTPHVRFTSVPFGGIFLNSNYEAGGNQIVRMKKCPADLDKMKLFDTEGGDNSEESGNRETIYICTRTRPFELVQLKRLPDHTRFLLFDNTASSKLTSQNHSFMMIAATILLLLTLKCY